MRDLHKRPWENKTFNKKYDWCHVESDHETNAMNPELCKAHAFASSVQNLYIRNDRHPRQEIVGRTSLSQDRFLTNAPHPSLPLSL